MTGRLEGKVAIITGAGSVGPGWGNGRATAIRFAQEGAKVFAVDKSEPALEQTLEQAAELKLDLHQHLCDVMDADSVHAMVEACASRFGKIDILVNNVGGSAHGGPEELSEADWDRQIDYNLKSVYLTCRYALKHLTAAGNGAIINTSSTSGIRWTGSPRVGYASAKAAVIQFSRVVAVEYGPQGVRVNTIVPGQLHTPMVEARLGKQLAGGDVDRLLKERAARIPLGFAGDGRDTANAALFLASDEARFISGTEIVVDGGMSARCD